MSAEELDAAFGPPPPQNDQFGPRKSHPVLLGWADELGTGHPLEEDSFHKQSPLPADDEDDHNRGRSAAILPPNLKNRRPSSVARIIRRFKDYDLDTSKIDPDLTDKSSSIQSKVGTGKQIVGIFAFGGPVALLPGIASVPFSTVALTGKGIVENRKKEANEAKLGKNSDKPYALTERWYAGPSEAKDYLITTNQKSKKALMPSKLDSSDKIFKFAFHDGKSDDQPVLIVRTKDRDEAKLLAQKADQFFPIEWLGLKNT